MQNPFSITPKEIKTLNDCRFNDALVHNALCAGASHEQIIVALCARHQSAIQRLSELESIAPKKRRGPDGKLYIWHCPDDLVPEEPALKLD